MLQLLHEYCTRSDKAFGYVTLHNKWQHWEDQYEQKPVVRPPKYTKSKTAHRKFEGWTKNGIKKYNYYYKKDQKESESRTGRDLEEEYRKTKKQEDEEGYARWKRRKVRD